METFDLKNGRKLVVEHCDFAESPREWDNLGTMVCFHRRYDLGDKHTYNHNDYDSWEEMENAIIKNENVAVILPLYLYDHSGITMNTTGFCCRWDSCQVGFIFISKQKALAEYGGKIVTKKLKDKLKELTKIAKRRNKVMDLVFKSEETKTVKHMAKQDKERIGYKPEEGQTQWTRCCQNSGEGMRRRPTQYTPENMAELLKWVIN